MIARGLSALFLAAAPASLSGQSPFDAAGRTAPQAASYRFGAPVGRSIEQLAIPVAVVIPFGPRLFVDIATAYASTEVTGGDTPASRISGLTDTQIRGTYTLGNDALVLTAGLNMPTGQSTVTAEQIEAAGRIGSDFLTFPISNMGTGLAATAGVGIAQPAGAWNVGAGASFRRSAEYEPFEISGQRPRFQPGDEIRIRLGADRSLGGGRFTVGATYSAFSDDEAGAFTYSTGDRWVAQGTYSHRVSGVDLGIAAWNLLRTTGRSAITADSSVTTPWENIAALSLSAGLQAGTLRLEPNAELRAWSRGDVEGEPSGGVGQLGSVGLRSRIGLLGLDAIPSIAYSAGEVKTSLGDASLSGWRAAFVVRLGR